jgi:hypothetical protein
MALQIFGLPGARRARRNRPSGVTPSAAAHSPRPGGVHHGADVGIEQRGRDGSGGAARRATLAGISHYHQLADDMPIQFREKGCRVRV